MKKYILFSVFVVSLIFVGGLKNAKALMIPSTTYKIFENDFGIGDNAEISSPWQSSSSENLAYKATSGENSASSNGGRFARIYTNEWICAEIDASNYKNLKISYEWRGDGQAESQDKGVFEYKKDGNCTDVDFAEINMHDLTSNSWTQINDQELSSDLKGSSFLIKFRTISNANNEFFRIDNVIITGELLDTTKPVITLEDETEINIYIGMVYPFTELKYTATDDTDGDITDKVVIDDSEIDNTKLGNYKLYYNVSDEAGNKADEVSRNINVVGGRRRNTEQQQTDTTTPEATTQETITIDTTTTEEGNAGNTTTEDNTPDTNSTPTETQEEPQGEVLGEETFKFTQFMKFGTRGGEVSELQKRLTKEGFFTGPITGYFGPLTREAVRKYQKANPPLKVDGIVGPKTRAVLNGEN